MTQMPRPATTAPQPRYAPGGNELAGANLVKNYGAVRALAGVNISVPQGQTLAIMGPSGSGKSTLLHVLSGILKPDAGEVRIGGQVVSSYPIRRALSCGARTSDSCSRTGNCFPSFPHARTWPCR